MFHLVQNIQLLHSLKAVLTKSLKFFEDFDYYSELCSRIKSDLYLPLTYRHTHHCDMHILNVKVESEAWAAAGVEGRWSTLRDEKKCVLMLEGVNQI
jgi:hypothetical protein